MKWEIVGALRRKEGKSEGLKLRKAGECEFTKEAGGKKVDYED
jgi:hypothetical protein